MVKKYRRPEENSKTNLQGKTARKKSLKRCVLIGSLFGYHLLWDKCIDNVAIKTFLLHYFILAVKTFFRVYILSSKHEEGLGEFKKVKQTRDYETDALPTALTRQVD